MQLKIQGAWPLIGLYLVPPVCRWNCPSYGGFIVYGGMIDPTALALCPPTQIRIVNWLTNRNTVCPTGLVQFLQYAYDIQMDKASWTINIYIQTLTFMPNVL